MAVQSAQGETLPHWPGQVTTSLDAARWRCACGKFLQYPPRWAGKKGRCPACGRNLVLPDPHPVDGALQTLRGHQGSLRAAAFSPDGTLLATCAGQGRGQTPAKSDLGETLLWEARDGHWESGIHSSMDLHWHRDFVSALAFSPDNRWLATGSHDRTIALWDVGRGLWDTVMGIHERSLRAHLGAVTSLAFRGDGSLLASACEDDAVKLWNTESWQLAATLGAGRKGACHLAFSPGGEWVAAVWRSRGPAIVWDVASLQEQLELRLRADEDLEDYGLAFSPDGRRLAVLGTNEVRIWDLSSCQVLSSFQSPGARAVAWSPLGDLLATGGWDAKTRHAVFLWNPSTGAVVSELAGHRQPVETVAFSADGRRLVSGGQDGLVNIWPVPELPQARGANIAEEQA
jgi:WD40 repeat protein